VCPALARVVGGDRWFASEASREPGAGEPVPVKAAGGDEDGFIDVVGKLGEERVTAGREVLVETGDRFVD